MKYLSILTIFVVLDILRQMNAQYTKYHLVSRDISPGREKKKEIVEGLEDCAWLCDNSECCPMFSYHSKAKNCYLFDEFTSSDSKFNGMKTYKSFKKFKEYQRTAINWFITAKSKDECTTLCKEIPTCNYVLKIDPPNNDLTRPNELTCYLQPVYTYLENLNQKECEEKCLAQKDESCKSFLYNQDKSSCWLYKQEFDEEFRDFDDNFSYFEKTCRDANVTEVDPNDNKLGGGSYTPTINLEVDPEVM